jgi:hypothetical protein
MMNKKFDQNKMRQADELIQTAIDAGVIVVKKGQWIEFHGPGLSIEQVMDARNLGNELAEAWRLRCEIGKTAPLSSMPIQGTA